MRQYCDLLTKEDCRRQSGSFIACDKVSDKDNILLLFYLFDFISNSSTIYWFKLVYRLTCGVQRNKTLYLHFLLALLDVHL